MDGHFLIGARAVTREAGFSGFDPSRGEEIAPIFSVSTTEDVAEACRLAAEAFDRFR